VASTGALFLGSVVTYWWLLAPVDTMSQEPDVFRDVERAASGLELQANRLVIYSFGMQKAAFDEAKGDYEKALKSVEGVKALVAASAELGEAVASVKKLGNVSAKWLEGVSKALDSVLKDAESEGLSPASTTWAQFSQAAYSGQAKDGDVVKFDLAKLFSQLRGLNESLTLTGQVIRTKDATIREGVAAIKVASTVAGLSVILLALLVALILSFIIAEGLSQAFRSLGSTVARIGAGDLRLRFQSRRTDELGTLGRDFDGFLESLTLAFRRIQDASTENLQVKDQLVDSAASATSSAVQIEANSESILEQLKKADQRIHVSQNGLAQVATLQDAFLRH